MKDATKKRVGIIAVLMAIAGAPALTDVAPTWAAAGDLDPTFGTGGKVVADFSGVDRITAAVLQPDGKIVVAGGFGPVSESGFVLARYNTDGSLDTSFGVGGNVTTGVGGHIQIAFALAVQPDGKLLATGNSGDNFATVRYNPDGSVDTSFGSGGVVVTVFGGFGGSRAITIQQDGKIIVGGLAGGPNWYAAMARYNTDGSLDAGFGSGGMVSSVVGGAGLTVQSDGKVLATSLPGNIPAGYDFAVARFNPDGSPDTSFGTNGIASTGIAGGFDQAFKIILQPDGRIVAAGGTAAGASSDFAMVRYLQDGSFDTSFSGGKVSTDIAGSDGVNAAVQLSDGKIVLSGCSNCDASADFALARYNADGSLDTSFSSGGKVITDLAGGYDQALALVAQPDGKLVAAGPAGQDRGLVRYQSDGGRQLTVIDPARVWIGLKNSDDVGIKFDLLAEVYKDGGLVSSGQVDSFGGGSSGFNNAHLATIPLSTFSPVSFPAGSQLQLKVSVRNACSFSTKNSGTARLWYSDAAANSRFTATIDSAQAYYLRDGFQLGVTPGPGPKKSVDVQAGAKCSPFKTFGIWSITP